ncbi:MAG: hypothetical protein ACREUZ_22755, partial [Burkholderiales bacterium]
SKKRVISGQQKWHIDFAPEGTTARHWEPPDAVDFAGVIAMSAATTRFVSPVSSDAMRNRGQSAYHLTLRSSDAISAGMNAINR